MSDVYKKVMNRITDNYNRNENSNISKMMKLAANHIQENEELLQQLSDWRDIDQAEGVTLDYIGRNIGQDRMGFDDLVFRVLLKSRIIRNNSDGSIPTILKFLSFILGVDKQYIKIQEKWKTGKPVGMYIEIDIEYAVAIGIPLEEFGAIVNSMVVGGVHVDLYYIGSFMFSDNVDQIQEDADHGFLSADIVTDVFYYRGDFRFGEIDEKTKETSGFSDVGTSRGGRFGGYFKINGFKDGTNSMLKPW